MRTCIDPTQQTDRTEMKSEQWEISKIMRHNCKMLHKSHLRISISFESCNVCDPLSCIPSQEQWISSRSMTMTSMKGNDFVGPPKVTTLNGETTRWDNEAGMLRSTYKKKNNNNNMEKTHKQTSNFKSIEAPLSLSLTPEGLRYIVHAWFNVIHCTVVSWENIYR